MNGKDPAHPLDVSKLGNGEILAYLGLTKREYIAIKAMQAILIDNHNKFESIAKEAYQMADAMIKEANNE